MDKPKRYVGELIDWELPRSQEREAQLVEQVLANARIPYFNREHLGEALYDRVCEQLRSLAATAINETIEYWLKGLADGNNGTFPEMCVELPYLHGLEEVPPLTLLYGVPNEDHTRTEINRTTLEAVLTQWLESTPPSRSYLQRGQFVVNALRHLARTVEERLHGERDRVKGDPSV